MINPSNQTIRLDSNKAQLYLAKSQEGLNNYLSTLPKPASIWDRELDPPFGWSPVLTPNGASCVPLRFYHQGAALGFLQRRFPDLAANFKASPVDDDIFPAPSLRAHSKIWMSLVGLNREVARAEILRVVIRLKNEGWPCIIQTHGVAFVLYDDLPRQAMVTQNT